MHNMLFEDTLHPLNKVNGIYKPNEDKVIVISNMLSRFLTTERTKVLFSGSSHNLFKIILNRNYSRIIVYYDLVYDNPLTISNLSILLKQIIDYSLTNVAVVPIHCIEWHCIKCFGREGELKKIAIDCLDYTSTEIYKFNMNHSKSTHEKFCKAVFGEIIPSRFHGSCLLNEYNITEEDEMKLALSLPLIFSIKPGLKSVIVSDYLRNYYMGFIEKFTCDDSMKNTFISILNRYLSILEF